jgi:AraC family transcriptional regulator, regulatory protein of adaptative response / methylphosphotriester-DNA alkyltransferase methyltransferase
VEQLAEHTTGELLRRPELSSGVELEAMRPQTFRERRRLYLLARMVIMRYYRTPLTIEAVARSLASSPRQLQRAFSQFGNSTFREDLRARRMAAAAELLSQPTIRVSDVAPLVGYRQPSHFARAFRCLYGVSPTVFRDELRQARCREAPGNDRGMSRQGTTVSRRERATAQTASLRNAHIWSVGR